VNVSCNPDGTVHYDAVVRNNGPCTVTNVPYKIQLQVRSGANGRFVGVVLERHTGDFPPGDTHVVGDICYQFQPGQTDMRIYTQFDNTNRNCMARDHLSPFIDVCDHPDACPGGFADVQSGNPFFAGINGLASSGAISGYADGTFRPTATITRGQIAKIVVLAFSLTGSNGGQHFSDVPANHTFYSYIETAYAHNLNSGYGDGTFRPGNNVTRGQVAKIVVQAAGLALVNPARATFRDVAAGSTFYRYVETAYANGLLSGYADGTFRPSATATRGQIAQISMSAATNQRALNDTIPGK